MQTIGLSLAAGFVAARKDSGNKVLVVEIATLVVAFICVFLGGKILKVTKTDKITSKLGPTFVVLSIVLATVLIAAQVFDLGGANNVIFMALGLVFAVAFFIFDTKFILTGKYTNSPMTPDDYIFASMKLYADFILIFTILMSLCE